MLAFLVLGAFCHLRSPHAGSKPSTNLADTFLDNPHLIQTREQRIAAIRQCLDEISSVLQTRATRRDITTQLSTSLETIVRSTEMRDKDMKRRFEALRARISSLNNTTRTLMAAAESELDAIVGGVRGEALAALNDVVINALEKGRHRGRKVRSRVRDHHVASLRRALLLFAVEQVLVVATYALYRAYQDASKAANL